MVRKYLVCAKLPYVVGTKPDSTVETAKAIEVVMPVGEYWNIQEIEKELSYQRSVGENKKRLINLSQDLYKKCVPFAVNEKDRLWLRTKLPKD